MSFMVVHDTPSCDICRDSFNRTSRAWFFYFTIDARSKRVDLCALCDKHNIDTEEFPTIHPVDEETYVVLSVLTS